MEVEHVRDLMDVMTEGMEAGELAPKTVNNTLTTLVVCLNARRAPRCSALLDLSPIDGAPLSSLDLAVRARLLDLASGSRRTAALK
jgi:hypothetical protein